VPLANASPPHCWSSSSRACVWLTLLNGGVTVKGRNGATAFATGGAAALAMVGLWLLAASLGLLLWLRA